MDTLTDARMVCVHDANGVLIAGKERPADPPSWVTLSGEFVVAACAMGYRK